MGFDRAKVDISCDACGLESEPIDLVAVARGYSLDAARDELIRDGWLVGGDDRIICPDCQEEG